MKREALDQFYENDVKPLLKECVDNLEADFQINKKDLKDEFIASFKEICKEIKKVEVTTGLKTGFIMYNLLRTRILQHQYKYIVVVYDKEWYLKDGVKVGELDVSFFYKHFDTLWQRLLNESRKYVMKISIVDVEKIVFDQLDYFHKYVVEMMRYSIIDAVET